MLHTRIMQLESNEKKIDESLFWDEPENKLNS